MQTQSGLRFGDPHCKRCGQAIDWEEVRDDEHIADVSKKVSISCGHENDPISRQMAIDAIAKFVPYAICDESTESYTNGLTDAYNLILQLPTVQPEIIQCKDCKHWRFDHTCREHSLVSPMMANEFCSRAERINR